METIEKRDFKQGKETKSGFCPKCGAYVGAFYSCPWCRTKMPHGTKLRAIQIGSFVAVILGLIFMSFYARIDPAPKVDIGDIDAMYANGTVTIEGEITNIDLREAKDESWRTLIFTVEDDTGDINVKAYTETTDELIEEENTPAVGDDCTVRGSVFIRGEEIYILLESSNYLDIDRPVDFLIYADDLIREYQNHSLYYIGKRATVIGEVSWISTDGYYFDLNLNIKIFFPDYVREFSPDTKITLIVGDVVEATGIIQDYYGLAEVLPATMDEVEIIGHGGA